MSQAKRQHLGLAGAYLLAAIALGTVTYDRYRVSSTVAVVDLAEIASKLGSDKQLEEAVGRRADKLNHQLVIVRQQLEGQIAATEKKAKEFPESKAAKSLPSLRRNAEELMAQANQKAAANLNSYRTQIVSQFRQQSRSVASDIAKERGISLVVEKNDAIVVGYESAIDISSQVAERGAIQLTLAMEPTQETRVSTSTR